jgi:hypothetical protein
MVSSLLVFFYNGLGDAFLALPALRALSQVPKLKMAILTNSNDPIFNLIMREISSVDLIGINIEEKKGGKNFDVSRLGVLRKNYEWLVCLNEWSPTEGGDHFRQVCAEKKSIGCFEFFNAHIIRPNRTHTMDYLFEFAKYFDSSYRIDPFMGTPKVDLKYQSIVSEFKQKVGSMRLLVMHMDTQKEKMWDEVYLESFLSHTFLNYPQLMVIMIGVSLPVSSKFSDEIRLVRFEDTDFRLPWCLVAQADYFIGVDSVFLHIADFYNIPSIGLFGPTCPEEWGFRATRYYRHLKSSGAMGDILPEYLITEFSKLVAIQE